MYNQNNNQRLYHAITTRMPIPGNKTDLNSVVKTIIEYPLCVCDKAFVTCRVRAVIDPSERAIT